MFGIFNNYYVSLIWTTVPSVIVIIMLVLEIILFAVVLERSVDFRRSLIAEKEQIDSFNFTRLTLCIFAVFVKHVFTSGQTMIVFEFNL